MDLINNMMVSRDSIFDADWNYSYSEDTFNSIRNKINSANAYFKYKSRADSEKTYDALARLSEYLKNHSEFIAKTDARWTSRSIYELNTYGIKKATETIDFFLQEYRLGINDQLLNIKGYRSIRIGVGLVAAITPWNDPMVAFAWKVVPALLSGNAVVWKPSENCIESAVILVGELYANGVKENQLQLVLGGVEQGRALVAGGIDGLSFTGSVKTSLSIQGNIGKIIKSNIEAGGKGHLVISDSIEPDQLRNICTEIVHESYSNQGQICSAPTVIHVSNKLKDDLINLFMQLSKKYIPGNPLDPSQIVGQLISKNKAMALGGIVKSNSRNLVMGGELIHSHGITPTLIQGVDRDNPLIKNELFGPIVTLLNYSDINSSINIINSSNFGLANGIYSNDIGECRMFSEDCNSGILHINSWGKDSVGVPFGGIKDSGNSKEKCLDSLKNFTYEKIVCETLL